MVLFSKYVLLQKATGALLHLEAHPKNLAGGRPAQIQPVSSTHAYHELLQIQTTRATLTPSTPARVLIVLHQTSLMSIAGELQVLPPAPSPMLTRAQVNPAMPRMGIHVLAALIGLVCASVNSLEPAQPTLGFPEPTESSTASREWTSAMLKYGEPETCHLKSPMYHWRNVGWGSNMNRELNARERMCSHSHSPVHLYLMHFTESYTKGWRRIVFLCGVTAPAAHPYAPSGSSAGN